ncbi:MAG TPA: hypothetical protein VHB27_15190 [Rhodopila sp.]|nr:hypothetical protein [Rhodopila sp.]
MIRRHGLVLVIAAFASTATWNGAWAQFGVVGGAGGLPGGVLQNGDGAKPAQKPAPAEPSGIPGAKARQPAAPATHAASDMSPNDALFDAIDRGDIAAARDALNRGADLDARNVLGMTPMELSVDLGRNDISFLLLSLRGEDGDQAPRSAGRNAGQGTPVLATGKSSSAPTPVARTRRAPAKASQIIAEKPIAAPKLWANDGGAPQPSAGFLGFGSRQASN